MWLKRCLLCNKCFKFEKLVENDYDFDEVICMSGRYIVVWLK